MFEEGERIELEKLMNMMKVYASESVVMKALGRIEQRYFERAGGVIFFRNDWWVEFLVRAKGLIGERFFMGDRLVESQWTILAYLYFDGSKKQSEIDYLLGTDCAHYILRLRELGMIAKRGKFFEATNYLKFMVGGFSKKEKFGDEEKDYNRNIFKEEFFDDLTMGSESIF